MSNENYCTSRGYDYTCNTPMPRSAFNASGPLCNSIAQFLYEPANCDEGYWCGCSSTDPTECIPSNDTTKTLWGGHFTTTNSAGAKIVLIGRFNDSDTGQCTSSYFCPGSSDPELCVDLCPPGYYCPTPGEILECPKGSFCPVATVVPKKCSGLENCPETGLRRFKMGPATIVMLVIIIASIVYLYAGLWFVNRSARKRKQKVMETRGNAGESFEDGADEDGEEERGDPVSERKAVEETEEVEVSDGEKEKVKVALSSEKEEPNCPVERTFLNRRLMKKGRRRRKTISAPEMTIDIECEKLRLAIPGVGTIMRGVSGKINHGNLTAIMGPSGAGKTTFLSLMSGKVDRTGGTLKVNGQDQELSAFRRTIGFVPQEDIMLRELTVEENITHSALMRLPVNWPHAQKMERVEEILEALEIGHVRDTVVGDEKKRGVSGGQRKRVNIAMEMVTKPSLLCLDEPTSGLDSTTSYTVINSLKAMARAGANVITVLHQPKFEVFELFDNVLLLGKGGITVYYGPTTAMSDYFGKRGFPCPQHSNPADFYMDVLSGIIPHPNRKDWDKEELFEEWAKAEENPDRMSDEDAEKFVQDIRSADDTAKQADAAEDKRWAFPGARIVRAALRELKVLFNHLHSNVKPDMTGRHTPGVLGQAYLLFKRANLQRLRTPGSTTLNIVLMLVAGMVIPSLIPADSNLYVGIPKNLNETSPGQEAYLVQNVQPVDEIPATLTNVYFFMLMVSCLSVNVYGPERVVFFRETAVGQSVTSYWMAKTLEVWLWLPILTCSFCLLSYGGASWLIQPLRQYWTFLWLDLVGFYGLGMLASLLVGTGSAALLALVFGIIIIVLFSGTVTAYGDQSSGGQTFTTFWFLFWSTQGIALNEYDQFTYAFNIPRLNDETPDKYDYAFGTGGQAVGAGVGFGFDLESGYQRNAVLCAITVFAWYVLILWTLKTKDHRKHR